MRRGGKGREPMTHTKSAEDAIVTGRTAMRALALGAFALGAAAILQLIGEFLIDRFGKVENEG